MTALYDISFLYIMHVRYDTIQTYNCLTCA